MKILILGAGQVGSSVAAALATENNDITVVDVDHQRLRELAEKLDIRTVVGHASLPSVLAQSGAEEAGLLVAVTSSDEVNLIACQVAEKLFKTATRVARLRESEYLSDEYSIADMAVWPWTRFLALLEIDVAEYPHVSRWSDVVGRRPAVQRVFTSTATAPDPAYLREKRVLTDEEWSNTYGERMLQAARLVPDDACEIEAKA